MEMLKPHQRFVRRTFQTGLWLHYRTSVHQVQLHAKINRLQIDNQLSDCIFPVILAPVPPPKSVSQSLGNYCHLLFGIVYVSKIII
jgi:vacuolar protein sorting-associated protein 13A/C